MLRAVRETAEDTQDQRIRVVGALGSLVVEPGAAARIGEQRAGLARGGVGRAPGLGHALERCRRLCLVAARQRLEAREQPQLGRGLRRHRARRERARRGRDLAQRRGDRRARQVREGVGPVREE